MSDLDTKLKDALNNYSIALNSLKESSLRDLSDPVIIAGLIKNFEFSYELSWVTLKRYLEKEGHLINTAREAFSKAYEINLIENESLWLEMIKDRNKTVHTYDKEFAKSMVERIVKRYLPELQLLLQKIIIK